MAEDEDFRRRDRLVRRLVEEHGLEALVAAACANAGIEGREQQVAYCLVVLIGKDDPARSSAGAPPRKRIRLDPEAAGFAERLAEWAATVAANLRGSAEAYARIHDEADRYEIATLRRLIRVHPDDDVIDRLSDELGAVITGGPRLEEMSLERARGDAPAGGQYAFQTPLPRWLATAARRRAPRQAKPPDGDGAGKAPGGGPDVPSELELGGKLAAEALQELIGRVAELAETRGLIAEALERADELEAGLARVTPVREEDRARFVRLRAELVYVADELRRRGLAMVGMLAYVVLAMRTSTNLQRVAVLSLRLAAIDCAAIDGMAAAMRAIIRDEAQPTPRLVTLTRWATDRRAVPTARAKALDALRAAPDRRADALGPVARMLDELPPIVAGVEVIAAVTRTSSGSVATYRHAAAAELAAVDAGFGSEFRRYAMGRS